MIEAIAERLDWKRDLYEKIAPHVAPHAILASNTSGLSLAALSAAVPAALRPRFCGIHFFNPPRYMYLVEVIAAPETDAALLDALEAFLTTTLGKGVIRAQGHAQFHRQPHRHLLGPGDDEAHARRSDSPSTSSTR